MASRIKEWVFHDSFCEAERHAETLSARLPHAKNCNHSRSRAVIYSRGEQSSRRVTLICMKAFFARGVMAIRDWWQRNFQLAIDSARAGQTASGKGNWFSFFSAGRSAPASMIPRQTIRITNIGTETDMGASKSRPSIVRVIRIIRVRRRRPGPAGESRFLNEFGGRKIANG